MNAAAPDEIRDSNRLAAVLATGLLDTAPEKSFDDLTALAAQVLDVPFAFATVVDEARSFWKSRYGLPADAPRQNTVEESFCQYVVRTRHEFVVSDAAQDPRTKTNPSVESMGVRAWAGFPVFAPGGQVLGSFCAVDTKPREWTPRDLTILSTLASSVSREIALRAVLRREHDERVRVENFSRLLQASLRPPAIPAVPGIDIGACYHPAGSGIDIMGDFYDVFKSAGDSWSFVLGDVCGKGIQGARVASLSLHTVGAAAMRNADPSGVLALLNERLLSREADYGVFVTLLFGTFQVNGACRGHRAGTTAPRATA